jgi:hypothetical protein
MSKRYNCSLSRLIFFGVPPPQEPVEGGGSVITLLRSCFNSPTALAVSDTTCKQVLVEQLAKILSGGRSCLNYGFNAKALGTSDAKI